MDRSGRRLHIIATTNMNRDWQYADADSICFSPRNFAERIARFEKARQLPGDRTEIQFALKIAEQRCLRSQRLEALVEVKMRLAIAIFGRRQSRQSCL